MRTRVIYEDKDVIVIYKPPGLAAQTAEVGRADVVSELKNYLAASGSGKPPYLGIVHRLDQPVEGLLVFAKNKRAAASLTKQLAEQGGNRPLNKRYYAVLCGKPSRTEGKIVDDMYREAAKSGRAVIVESGCESPVGTAPKKAVLQYRILQTVQTPSGEEISLADIQIETGRFHQIRAQMAHAGMALLGDEKYADEAVKACSRRLGIRTVALCAYSLAFVHPATGERLRFEAGPMAEVFSFFKL